MRSFCCLAGCWCLVGDVGRDRGVDGIRLTGLVGRERLTGLVFLERGVAGMSTSTPRISHVLLVVDLNAATAILSLPVYLPVCMSV